jgi:hypothetical protein
MHRRPSRGELRRVGPSSAEWPVGVVLDPPRLDNGPRLEEVANATMFNISSRACPLNDST